MIAAPKLKREFVFENERERERERERENVKSEILRLYFMGEKPL